jgi:hypothetical protein
MTVWQSIRPAPAGLQTLPGPAREGKLEVHHTEPLLADEPPGGHTGSEPDASLRCNAPDPARIPVRRRPSLSRAERRRRLPRLAVGCPSRPSGQPTRPAPTSRQPRPQGPGGLLPAHRQAHPARPASRERRRERCLSSLPSRPAGSPTRPPGLTWPRRSSGPKRSRRRLRSWAYRQPSRPAPPPSGSAGHNAPGLAPVPPHLLPQADPQRPPNGSPVPAPPAAPTHPRWPPGSADHNARRTAPPCRLHLLPQPGPRREAGLSRTAPDRWDPRPAGRRTDVHASLRSK